MPRKIKPPDDQTTISQKRIPKYDHLLPYVFKPGQSGNPGGRPPGIVSLPTEIKRIADEAIDSNGQTRLKVLLRTMFQEAIEGDKETRQVLFDQGWGTLIHKQMNFDVSAALLEAAKVTNVDPNTIRSDPLLFAIFAAAGLDPDRITQDATVSERESDSVIIDNPKTPNG